MKHLFFWNNWHTNYRILYISLLAVLGISLLALGYYRFMGLDATISWSNGNTVQSLPVIIDQFNKGLMNYSVQADSYLVYQNFEASDIQLNPIVSYIFLGVIILMFSLFMATISSIKNNWYYLFGVFAVLFLVGFKFNLIEVFGFKNDLVLGIGVVLYLGVSYYLVAFNRNLTLLQHFAIFTILSVVFFGTILIGAEVKEPALHLVSYGILAPLVITILLILITAFDNIQVFLYLITGTSNSSTKGNALNFVFISLLYLLNIVLVYMKMSNSFEFNVLYIDIMIIFASSVISGIWGYRKRSEMINTILPFEIQGAIVYLCMAIIGTLTILVQLTSSNTPMIIFFETIIVYAQISLGVMFLIFILANFAIFLLKNQKVHLIVYKPQKLPFAMVPALGLVIFGALFMKSDMALYNYGFAGYYNTIGDTYKIAKSDFLAEEYYKKGKANSHFNFKSNYSLGCIARALNNTALSVYYFEDATFFPNEYAFLNLANCFDENENLLSKMESLKAAREKFPKSGKISNNLALIFRKTNLNDSTMFYLKQARVNEEQVALTNMLAYAIEKGGDNINEAILKDDALDDYPNHAGLQANKLFIYNKLHKRYEDQFLSNLFEDTALNNNNFAYFINYQLSKIKNSDTTIINQLATLIKKDTAGKFTDDLKFLKAAKYYYTGNKSRGIGEMYELTNTGTYNTGLYANTIGLWMMDQNAYGLAIDFFKTSKEKQNKTAGINLALAYSENGNFVEAYDEWQIVKASRNPAEYEIASLMIPIVMNAPLDQVMTWDDKSKSQFIHFRRAYFTKLEIGLLFNSLKDDMYKIQASPDLMYFYTLYNNPTDAINLYNAITNNYKIEPVIALEMNEYYIKALIQIQDYKAAAVAVQNKNIKPELQQYFGAIIADKNNNYKLAESMFSKVANNNPFNAEANIDAANFFSLKLKKQDKAYAILVNAVRNNPQSILVYKAYCIQAVKSGLYNFAEDALGFIKKYVDAEEYNKFKMVYDAEIEKALEQ